jgi:hypothetical protein
MGITLVRFPDRVSGSCAPSNMGGRISTSVPLFSGFSLPFSWVVGVVVAKFMTRDKGEWCVVPGVALSSAGKTVNRQYA